ncbi:isocitrate lyase/phosphoenolpyruvate mutase family protein [Dongia sp.]|uniref:isocitrate lyase/PEP mutase family protein n=1 Tax=Dongia sp. TaxID=1977262 RepID=UPI0035AF60F8
MTSQAQRASAFKLLHEQPHAFIMPNPWDAGSACLLASIGFEALATTSAGLAFSLAKPDGSATREETLANIRVIAAATDLPLSADLENGFGDAPEICAETIRLGAEAGPVGGSIEDATGRPEDPIYPLDVACARIKAAARAAHALPSPFMLTARAENHLHGRNDLADTIKRLQAYAEAGADVLFAPGLHNADDICAIVQAVAPKPVNVVMGLTGSSLSLAALSALGVRRISVGGALARAAFGELIRAAEEMKNTGTFTFADRAAPFATLDGLFRNRRES